MKCEFSDNCIRNNVCSSVGCFLSSKIARIDSPKFCKEMNINLLCEELKMSRTKFLDLIKERFNITSATFLQKIRIDFILDYLNRDQKVKDLFMKSGFYSLKTFRRVFYNQIGETPGQIIKELKQHPDPEKAIENLRMKLWSLE